MSNAWNTAGTEWSYKSDGQTLGEDQGNCEVEYGRLKTRVTMATSVLVTFGFMMVEQPSKQYKY